MDISVLYNDYPSVYAAFARDRNFIKETSFFLSVGNYKRKIIGTKYCTLELFAGPAYHSNIIQDISDTKAYCIDCSSGMKDIAIDEGFKHPDQYFISKIPCDFSKIFYQVKFDLIFVPRYSIGYLSPIEIKKLLRYISICSNNTSIIIFEVHTANNIRTKFKKLSIQLREFEHEYGNKIICSWPSDALKLNNNTGSYEMPVEVTLNDISLCEKKLKFTSTEYLHKEDDILTTCLDNGINMRKIKDHHLFPESVLLVGQL